LAGDSAGADPFVGEGISFALSYGQVAADAIIDAFALNDFAFSDYRQRILEHNVLKQLPVRVRLARLAYRIKSPRIFRLGWRAAQYLIRYSSWSDPDHDPVKKPIQGYDVRKGVEPLITP
jgi:flavin-dependent dehydrogenase